MAAGGEAGCHAVLLPVRGHRAASGADSSAFLTAEVWPVHSLGGAVAIHVPIGAITPTLLGGGRRVSAAKITEAFPGATTHTTASVFVALPEGRLAGCRAGPAATGQVIITPGEPLSLGCNNDV